MQLSGDLDILSFVRISRLNWIGRVNRMDSKRKVSQCLVIILWEVHSEDVQKKKTDGETVRKQTLIDAKL